MAPARVVNLNPSSISIPGVAESSIRPSSNNGDFIKLKSGGWGAVPTSDFSKKSMKVSVSGVLNGKRKQVARRIEAASCAPA